MSWHVKFDSQNLKHSGDLARWSTIAAHRRSPIADRPSPIAPHESSIEPKHNLAMLGTRGALGAKSSLARVDDQSPDTLISGHLAFQNEKAPDLHFWTIAGAVQFGLAHKIRLAACSTGNYYPARACASKGLCDRSWCLYIVYYILYIISLHFFLEPIFDLPKYSLSEVQFNTDRLLIEFNGLWYSLAARQVFVAITNPDNLSFG